MLFKTIFLLLYLIVGLFTSIGADTLISPADPRINYYGRIDFTDPENPAFNWSGAIIEANFPGPTIGMKLSHSSGYYDVEIDGKIEKVVSCGEKKQFIFSTSLTSSLHTLRIILRSEDHYSKGIFQGLYLANGKTLSEAPVKPGKKIEFIGDSYSAGYGVESQSRTCDTSQLHKYTNANKAFPMLITNAFHGQSIILGWSGAGVVRNYGDSKKRSDKPYPFYYDRFFGEVSTQKWDFTRWIPDLVVICLGTNDFSTNPHPDDSMYTGDYHKLISRIITNYPSAKVCCVATNEEIIKRLVKKVVSEENTTLNHSQVFQADFPASIENTGCDWHPSINDNQKIASGVVNTIMQKLSWDTAGSKVAISTNRLQKYRQPSLSVQSKISALQFSYSSQLPQSVYLISINGSSIAHTVTDCNGKGTFLTATLAKGMYLMGNNHLGWKMVSLKM